MASQGSDYSEGSEGTNVAKLRQLFQSTSDSSLLQRIAPAKEASEVSESVKEKGHSQSIPDKPEDKDGLNSNRAQTLPASPVFRRRVVSGTPSRQQGPSNLNSHTPHSNSNSLPAMKLTSGVTPLTLRRPMPLPSQDVTVNSSDQTGEEQVEFLEEGCPKHLSDMAKYHPNKLPQLFRAKENYSGPPEVREGDILLVQYKKTIKVAHGTTNSGRRITLAHNCKLLLTPQKAKECRQLTAKCLLSSKSLPPAMVVMTQFTHAKRQMYIQTGTILLNIHVKRDSRLHNVIVAEDTTGQTVDITASCPGVFSIHPDDIQLHLVQLVHYCKLPVKVYQADSCEAITVQEIGQQEVLVVQRFSKNSFMTEPTETFELPADCDLKVVNVVSLADKCKGAKIPYYSVFRLQEGDDDTRLYESLREPTAVQWRSVLESRSGARMQRPLSTPFPSTTAGASATLDSAECIENNLAYLKSLTVDEVVELLEAMQLEEYKESFKREKIDGEVLSSLTEADLLHELNIQKRLHRVRLMKVIEGVHSVQAKFHELYI